MSEIYKFVYVSELQESGEVQPSIGHCTAQPGHHIPYEGKDWLCWKCTFKFNNNN